MQWPPPPMRRGRRSLSRGCRWTVEAIGRAATMIWKARESSRSSGASCLTSINGTRRRRQWLRGLLWLPRGAAMGAKATEHTVPPGALQIRPRGDRVLVKVAEEETKTRGGILLPTSAVKKPTSGAGGGAPCRARRHSLPLVSKELNSDCSCFPPACAQATCRSWATAARATACAASRSRRATRCFTASLASCTLTSSSGATISSSSGRTTSLASCPAAVSLRGWGPAGPVDGTGAWGQEGGAARHPTARPGGMRRSRAASPTRLVCTALCASCADAQAEDIRQLRPLGDRVLLKVSLFFLPLQPRSALDRPLGLGARSTGGTPWWHHAHRWRRRRT